MKNVLSGTNILPDCGRCHRSLQRTPRKVVVAAAERLLTQLARLAKVFSHAGVGRVVHDGHALGQRLTHGGSAAQHEGKQAIAQLLAEHFAHVEMQRERGIELVEHVVGQRGIGGMRRRCDRRRRQWS